MNPAANPTRAAAVKVLGRFEPNRQNLSELIEKFFHDTPHRGQGVDIVYGVVRNRATIDRLIATVSGREIDKIVPRLLDILRVMFYELVYTSQAGDYAIVNEAVTLAGKLGGNKAGGFVNAIGRKAAGHIKNKRVELQNHDTGNILPISPGIGCEFDIFKFKVICSAENNAQYLSQAFSLPLWLVESWVARFGFEVSLGICFGQNRRPSVYVRPNKLKTDAQNLYTLFRDSGIDCELLDDVKMISLSSPGNITKLPGFDDGLFAIQDITASKAVRLLNPQPGQIILDLCAAPGTKTCQIAELLGNSGMVVATDIDSDRAANIIAGTERLGVTSVKTIDYDAVAAAGPFDSILIDAPCSNSGVMAKRAEVRYRINQKSITALTEIQKQLLVKACDMLKPLGRICYSTCSICEDENEGNVNWFLKSRDDFELVSQHLILPSADSIDCDGGYAAVLERK